MKQYSKQVPQYTSVMRIFIALAWMSVSAMGRNYENAPAGHAPELKQRRKLRAGNAWTDSVILYTETGQKEKKIVYTDGSIFAWIIEHEYGYNREFQF
ncbi:MAG: hypothetical protein LBC19_14045 [Tannerella sp.]|jgi:hypothetical protein|nr:hypothetical protein [Tannerella sp.]